MITNLAIVNTHYATKLRAKTKIMRPKLWAKIQIVHQNYALFAKSQIMR